MPENTAQGAEPPMVAARRRLRLEFPEKLPITPLIPDIIAALQKHQVVVVCGSTGSGKTTQLPKAALLAGIVRRGRVGCTQPRRIAATALAARFADETGATVGREVGVQIRFDNRTSPETAVKFMTDGILLAETRRDRNLRQYDCLILDEVHERSLNIDFLLGYTKLLLERRRDLRIIISSATLESRRMSEFFGGAPVIEIPGGLFPIEDCYLDDLDPDDLSGSVARAAEFAADLDPGGDVLVFLPGEREIRDASDTLNGRRYRHTEILPLYGRLGAAEQLRVFRPSGGVRRIVLATNVAETSVTIPGIRFVIDSGLVRLSRYNPRTRIQELRVEMVSQAGARQRRGRCGRIADGVCIRLYSEEALQAAPEYTPPEIQRSSLAGVLLQMAELGLPPIEEFPLLDPPAPALVREGRRTLDDLHALDAAGKLTPLGRELARLPVDPHLGKLLVDAKARGVLPEMAVIAAALNLPDPRERPFEQAAAADTAHRKFDSDASDFLGLVKLWRAANGEEPPNRGGLSLRNFAKKNFLNFRRLREWRNLVADLLELFAPELDVDKLSTKDAFPHYDALHRILLGALPRQLAVYDPETRLYSDMGGRKFVIFPGSGLARRRNPPPWLLFFALMETSRVFGRVVAEVKPLWLLDEAPQLCHSSYDQIHYEPERGFVGAREKVTAGALLINPGRRRHYGDIDPEAARECFILEGLVAGSVRLPGCVWLEKYNLELEELRSLETKTRRPQSLLDEKAAADFFFANLPEQVNSVETLKRDWLKNHIDRAPQLEDILQEGADIADSARDYPDFVRDSGFKLPLVYRFSPGEPDDGATLMVPEKALNVIDPHLADYAVPAYLGLKVERLLHALPKDLRRALSPLAATAEEFAADCAKKQVFTGRPLAEALADYLKDGYDVAVSERVFDAVELPAFLKTRIAVTSDGGKITRVLDEMPGRAGIGSRLAPSLRATAKFNQSGCIRFPGVEAMPLSIAAGGGKDAYPALNDEGNGVGTAVYLNRAEAEIHHRAGILRLYRLRFVQQAGHLARTVRFDHALELSFFLGYDNWRGDLVDSAILAALGCDPFEVRSEAECEGAFIFARDRLGRCFDEAVAGLKNVYLSYSRVKTLLAKLPKHSATGEDAANELAWLFRSGFLKTAEAVAEYPRYLRALELRLERACGSPLTKDEAKGAGIAPYWIRFTLAAETELLEERPALLKYFMLLEESRIAVFAPEVRLKVKAGPAVLAAAWRDLKLG